MEMEMNAISVSDTLHLEPNTNIQSFKIQIDQAY